MSTSTCAQKSLCVSKLQPSEFPKYRKNGRKNKNSCDAKFRRNLEQQQSTEKSVHPADSEPPVLTHTQLQQIYQYKKQRGEIEFDLKECERNLDIIKNGLLKTKAEIEAVRASQEKIVAKINNCKDRDELVALNDEQLKLHRHLFGLVDTEEKLIGKLDAQRRALAEARVNDQSFTLDMDDKIDGIYKMYQNREEFDYQRRLMKDKTIKKNTSLIRSKALKCWEKFLQEYDKTPSPETKPKYKVSEKFKQLAKVTFNKKKLEALNADADKAFRQSHQYTNLTTLKNRINEQKDIYSAEAKLRQERAKRRQAKEEAQKQKMIAAGENPYVSAKILEVARKQKEMERTAVHLQNMAVQKIAEEYDDVDRRKVKEEKSRIKWEQFWARRAREKKRREWYANEQFYALPFIPPGWENKPTIDPAATLTLKPDPYNFEILYKEHKLPDCPPPLKRPVILPPVIPLPPPESAEPKPEEDPILDDEKDDTRSNKSKKSVKSSKSRSLRDRTKSRLQVLEDDTGSRSSKILKKGGKEKVLTFSEEEEAEVLEGQKNPINSPDEKKISDGLIGSGDGKPLNIPAFCVAVGNPILKVKPQPSKPIFQWNPDIITFQNYVVGRTYKKRVTITNISLQISKVYFRGLISTDPPKVEEAVVQDAVEEENDKRKKVEIDISDDNDKTSRVRDKSKSLERKKSSKIRRKSKFSVSADENGNSKILERNLTPEPAEATDIEDKPEEKKSETPAPPPPVQKNYEITDVVHVDFEVPPALSPGISHSFVVTFKPKSLGDWKGQLRFESKDHDFSIPIQCLKTRPVLTLTPSRLLFPRAVVDTAPTLSVKLQNIGEKTGRIAGVNRIFDSDEQNRKNRLSLKEYLMESEPEGMEVLDSKKKSKKSSRRKTKKEIQIDEREPSEPVVAVAAPATSDQTEIRRLLYDLAQYATESPFVVYVDENQTVLEPGDFVHLKVHFHPPHIGKFFSSYEIQFDDPEVEPLLLELEGNGIEIPITIDPQHTNLKICVLDFNYQQTVTVSSAIKTPGKVIAQIPPALRNYIQVHPKENHLSASSSAHFSVKFHPSAQLFTQSGIEKFYDKETKIIDFPVYFELDFPIIMPGPLECTFQAVLTEAELVITPKEIDFGTCLPTETVKETISILNPSYVIQQIGFVDVPECISVQPNNGFGSILPYEEQKWFILLSPTKGMEGEHNLKLKIHTLQKGEQTIVVKFSVKSSPVSLAHSRICFPSTCYGSTSSATLELFSTIAPIKTKSLHSIHLGQDGATFEFLVDESFPIEIKPRSGVVESGKSTKVLVKFAPNISENDARNHQLQILRKKHQDVLGPIQKELDEIAVSLGVMNAVEEAEEDMKSTGQKLSSRRPSNGSEVSKGSKSKTARSRKGSRSGSVQSAQSLNSPMSGQQPGSTASKTGKRKTKAKDDLEEDDKVYSPTSVRGLQKRQAQLLKQMEEMEKEFLASGSSEAMENLEITKTRRELLLKAATRSQAFTIPCVVKDSVGTESVLLLNLKCPMRTADLVLLDSNVVNFESAKVGSKIIKDVHFHNVSPGPLSLKMDIVNSFGPFQRVNALRKVGPDQVYTLKLKFQPTAVGHFEDSLVISGGDSKIELILTGSTPGQANKETRSNSKHSVRSSRFSR